MRVVVIGGTGHIGTYLCPALIEAGHEVISVSRGVRQPYQDHSAWSQVVPLVLDRPTEEAAGTFGERIAEVHADIVIDLTCYTVASAQILVNALRGKVNHFLHCGTIWVHGPSVIVPTSEDAPRTPLGEYGCRKAAIEELLLGEFSANGFPATILHPGHLVGRGWVPVNPQGNFNLQVFSDLAAGRELRLPHLGMETLHPVHAVDVAQAFVNAVARRFAAIGESFHVVSASALTLRGYAESISQWFGCLPRLRFLPWEQWRLSANEKDAQITWNHIAHSSHCSIAKARRLLGYEPRYTSLEAVQEAVKWLVAQQHI